MYMMFPTVLTAMNQKKVVSLYHYLLLHSWHVIRSSLQLFQNNMTWQEKIIKI